MSERVDVEAVYRRHSFAVFRRCRFLLGNDDEARDVMHETFLLLIEKPDHFRGRSSMGTYLYAVATHLCLNRVRNTRARDQQWKQRLALHVANQQQRQTSPEAELDAKNLIERILRLADPKDAQIAVHHFVDGLSQSETASLVRLSRVRVNQRLQQFRKDAIAKIREEMP